jgi:hypothetical protein
MAGSLVTGKKRKKRYLNPNTLVKIMFPMA